MNELNISSLESLCNLLYNSTDNQERTQAGASLYGYLENSGNFRALFSILSASSHPQLIYLSLSSLCKGLPIHWRRLNPEEKQLLYQTILNMMLDGQDRAGFIYGGIAKALSRVCRLGWLELPLVRSVVESCKIAIEQNFYLSEVIFKFYCELIPEMTDPIKHRPVSVNRKTAISFRDEVLIQIFECSLCVLAKIQELPSQLIAPLLTALNLCLSFDFLGISSDETSEDSLCLQVPLTWKHAFENPLIMDYVGLVILNGTGQQETLALRCFNHLGAIRKSIFSGNIELRHNYIAKYLGIISEVLRTKQLESDSLFEFMQLTKRFMSSFSIREVSENPCFSEWLQSFANFTYVQFSKPGALTSGYTSGMYVWSYLSKEANHQLKVSNPVSVYVLGIFRTFLQFTLQNASEENLPIDKETDLCDHLELIGLFSASCYYEIMNELQERFAEFLAAYDPSSPAKELEEKLAWLLFVASSLIGLKEKNTMETQENVDSQMINLVFQLINKTNAAQKKLDITEASMLNFFQAINKVYLNSPRETSFYSKSEPQQISAETLQQVLATIVEKVLFVISNYQNKKLVSWSLDLFEGLCKGHYSSKALLKLELIQTLLLNYKSYPISSPDLKDRERVYRAIADLWGNDELTQSIEIYLGPMTGYINSICKNPQFPDIAYVFRELKGMCSSLITQRHFIEFFEWLNADKWGLFVVGMRNFLYNQSVMSSMFAFLKELTTSRNSRIKFDSTCAYGIIIFRTLSQVILEYGNFLLELPIGANPYAEVYSKIRKVLIVIRNLLCGGYVSFGVFEIYGDRCFIDTLNIVMALLARIPRQEVITYTRLLDTVYEIIELITKFHLGSLFLHLSAEHYRMILFFLKNGVNSTNMKYTLSTANAITSLCDYILKKSQKDTAESQAMQRGLQESSGELSELLEVIIEIVLTEDSSFMWSLSKPLLGLIIVNEAQYEEIKNFAIARVTADQEVQAKMGNALANLMAGVTRSLDVKNREYFGKKFTELRQNISFLNN